jgi:hypothetical protein
MTRLKALIVLLAILMLGGSDVFAWNIPGHMLSGSIA